MMDTLTSKGQVRLIPDYPAGRYFGFGSRALRWEVQVVTDTHQHTNECLCAVKVADIDWNGTGDGWCICFFDTEGNITETIDCKNLREAKHMIADRFEVMK